MTTRCMGQCKNSHTRDFTPETIVLPGLGWRFILHDTVLCPDRVKWHMNSLMEKAKALRDGR